MMRFDVQGVVRATGYLWLGLAALWMGAAPFTKKTVYQQPDRARYAQLAVLVSGLYLLFASRSGVPWLDRAVYTVTIPSALAGLGLVVAGIGFAGWARVILGGNWSGRATIKEDHTLVRRGPYRVVRHPIYTGLLMAILGSAVERGLVRSLLAVPLCMAGLWLKMRVEERIMLDRFGPEYMQYRREVRSLVPFVI